MFGIGAGQSGYFPEEPADIEFMVEGLTDNVPFRRGDLLDNWDLSVKRATSVIRILQNKYGLTPTHIAAAGRRHCLKPGWRGRSS
jgi:chemotaxis protein MotB